jgi:predicted dehydrogenase
MLVSGFQREGASVIGVADPNEARAREVGERAGCAAFRDYRALMDNQPLDALIVCGPPSSHHEQVLEAVTRGLAILCEKPLALDSSQAREMVEGARNAGVLLMVDFPHRQYEPTTHIRSMLSRGDLGELISFHVRFGVDYTHEAREWVFRPELAGGGVLMDSASHGIDLFRDLAGDVVRVSAKINNVRKALAVEDTGTVTLETARGTLGVVEVGWMTPGADFNWSVHGTRGAAYVTYDPPGFRVRLQGESAWRETIFPDQVNLARFDRQCNHFLAAMAGAEQPRGTGLDGLRSLEVIEAAYRSAKTGCSEPCGTVEWL